MGMIDGMLCFLLIPEKVTDLVELSAVGEANRFFELEECESNTFTAEQFKKYENQGVVALPCGGERNGTMVYDVGSEGFYWSSSANESVDSYVFLFCHCYVKSIHDYYLRGLGRAVRLVQDVL